MPVSKNDTGTCAMGKIAKLKPKYDLDRETVGTKTRDALLRATTNEGQFLS